MNHYELLGVSEKATSKEIRKAYLILVKKYHPDVNKEGNADRLFIDIKNAYDTLSDPKLREQYNLKKGITKKSSDVNMNKQRKKTEQSYHKTADKSSNMYSRYEKKSYNAHNKNNSNKYNIDKLKNSISKLKTNINKRKGKKYYHYAKLILIFIVFLFGAVFVRGRFDLSEEYYPKDFAIESVKLAYIDDDLNVEEQVKLWVENDNTVKRRIGWDCELVSENMYFVTYNYDTDNELSNGWMSICYEFNSSSDLVRKITDNEELIEKYKKLGYIE